MIFFSGFNSKPFRIEFFDNEIDEIREFNPETQHMVGKLNEFQLFTGSELSLDEQSINDFKSLWRDFFPTHDERHCEIFKALANGKIIEGYEIYSPIIHRNHSNLLEHFEGFDLITSKDTNTCLLYTSPSPRDATLSRMPSSA